MRLYCVTPARGDRKNISAVHVYRFEKANMR